MRVIDRLSPSQRVVVVVALGLALAVIGGYVVSLGSGASLGWYAYAPLTSVARVPGPGFPAWLRAIIWLALIGIWASSSIRVLRSPPGDSGVSSQSGAVK